MPLWGRSHCPITGNPLASKAYDRSYFTRWYHDPRTRIDDGSTVARKVHLAVAAAEFMLGRRIRSVLDVGCGEGRWYPPLRRLRPGIRYQGVDGSEWAVRRWGKRRHIRLGTLGALRTLRLAVGWDLVVCSDVLQYVPTADVERGLREIRRLVAGVAFIEAFAAEDAMEGDDHEWHHRSAAEYRRIFRGAGLTQCGMHCWVDLDALDNVNAFEIAGRA